MRYTVDGKTASATKTKAHVERQVEAENNQHEMRGMWEKAHEQSSDGYVAREYVECYGVTMRHPNEEQG